MKIVTVIPIAKGVFKENLSYFTSQDVDVGSLVSVPVKKKLVPALIISSQEIMKMKTVLRRSDFALKSLKEIISKNFLLPPFIGASKKIADYFLSNLGTTIKDFIPQIILKNKDWSSSSQISRETEKTYQENIIVQGPREERIQQYRRIVREEFVKNHSIFLCLPSTSEIENFAPELQKGIENYTVILNTNFSAKKIKESWNLTKTEKHPLLIIATKSFLSLPRPDLKVFIIEGENSSLYKLQTRSYIDIRKAVELLSSELKTKAIFGDIALRTETYYKNKSFPAHRIISQTEGELIETEPHEIISQEVREMIRESIGKKEKIILFINRRGYSPATLCKDCRKVILCQRCETPLVIHKDKKVKFICHKCLSEAEVPERCPYCQSWRLETFGLGIQKVIEEIKKISPEINVFRMDSDIVKIKKQGDEIAKKFKESNDAILIATEILFSYIKQKVDRIAVVSIDAMFTLPDFRINEKIFHLLLKLRALAKKSFFIQTKLSISRQTLMEQNLFENAIKGNTLSFYNEEIELRQRLQYPPFKMLIKITKEDKDRTRLRKDIKNMEKTLERWNPISYASFIPKIKNIYSWNLLLKLEPDTWPAKQQALRQLLFSLPPAWKINIDPESLL
ncbi:MAG: hypothetical protein AB1643_00235 [Patescibacteria group bacterium]